MHLDACRQVFEPAPRTTLLNTTAVRYVCASGLASSKRLCLCAHVGDTSAGATAEYSQAWWCTLDPMSIVCNRAGIVGNAWVQSAGRRTLGVLVFVSARVCAWRRVSKLVKQTSPSGRVAQTKHDHCLTDSRLTHVETVVKHDRRRYKSKHVPCMEAPRFAHGICKHIRNCAGLDGPPVLLHLSASPKTRPRPLFQS